MQDVRFIIFKPPLPLPLLLWCTQPLLLQSLLSLDLGVCSSGICLSHLTNLTSLRTDKLFSLEAGEADHTFSKCVLRAAYNPTKLPCVHRLGCRVAHAVCTPQLTKKIVFSRRQPAAWLAAAAGDWGDQLSAAPGGPDWPAGPERMCIARLTVAHYVVCPSRRQPATSAAADLCPHLQTHLCRRCCPVMCVSQATCCLHHCSSWP